MSGASGYVGSRIAEHLVHTGWEVRALCRSEPRVVGELRVLGRSEPGEERMKHVPFDLARGVAPGALMGVDALVHAAYDFSCRGWSEIARVNIAGSRRLLAAAREAGVERTVLVSTVAAFPGTRSAYGRAKLECERAALEAGAAVVRPGMVWGPQGAAIFGALRGAVARLPVVPVPGPAGVGLALVHEDDLATLVERLLAEWPGGRGEVLVAASPHTLTFAQLLRSLAPPGRRSRLLPIPWRSVWLGLRALEALGVRPPFRSDSLLSLATADGDPFAHATIAAEHYGVELRPYPGPCETAAAPASGCPLRLDPGALPTSAGTNEDDR